MGHSDSRVAFHPALLAIGSLPVGHLRIDAVLMVACWDRTVDSEVESNQRVRSAPTGSAAAVFPASVLAAVVGEGTERPTAVGVDNSLADNFPAEVAAGPVVVDLAAAAAAAAAAVDILVVVLAGVDSLVVAFAGSRAVAVVAAAAADNFLMEDQVLQHPVVHLVCSRKFRTRSIQSLHLHDLTQIRTQVYSLLVPKSLPTKERR